MERPVERESGWAVTSRRQRTSPLDSHNRRRQTSESPTRATEAGTLSYKMTQTSTWDEPMRRIITCLVVALVPLYAGNAQPLKPNTPSTLPWTPEQQRDGYR